jgi:hypothetical protein
VKIVLCGLCYVTYGRLRAWLSDSSLLISASTRRAALRIAEGFFVSVRRE